MAAAVAMAMFAMIASVTYQHHGFFTPLFHISALVGSPKSMIIMAGALYGLGVLVMTPFVLLPVAAAVAGSGATISRMAQMVGRSTFAIEHMMFGIGLGAVFSASRSSAEGSSGVVSAGGPVRVAA